MKTALDYAKQACDTLMRKFAPNELPPRDRYHYHQGVFLSGMERTYLLSKDEVYNNYLKAWQDYFVKEDGGIAIYDENPQFDDMQPATLLFRLYENTGEARYRKVLDNFVPIVERWPKNALGGFWHKTKTPNQMWLDGLYMIGPYCVMYASKFNKPYFLDTVYQQMSLMRRNMTDPKTGLLHHAWDDSRRAEWADRTTGLSPVFWGRAMGWYAVAITDILDYLPANYIRRQEFIDAERDIVNALIKFQDEETGLWHQVVDCGDDPANWFETSCTSLFTYAISKSIKLGILDESYVKYADRGYQGVVDTLTFNGDDLIVSKVCIGTGVGDYEFYLKRPTVANDLHGMGAFILMCTEYYDMKRRLGAE
jgi:unsaturated rhamnogalacturonyl hydrolase